MWEDTPASLYYTTTVSHDQEPEDTEEGQFMKNLKVREGETAAQAFARQQEELAEKESQDSESFLHAKKPQVWAKNKALNTETRPNLSQHRFPSRDVWEDNPDSLMLQTTVTGPQTSDEAEILSPPDERPTTGAVVFQQEKAAAGIQLGPDEGRATTGIGALMQKPSIPARPTRAKPTSPTDAREKPTVPLASKPSIPARPAKSNNDGGELTKTTSAGSAKSVGSDTSSSATLAALKAKPPVPSRPVGSKIAALQGGFMADLNKKLGLGPQQPKEVEPEADKEEEATEKAPLADARKGRARGPARRAPAKDTAPASSASGFTFSSLMTVFEHDPESGLQVPEHSAEDHSSKAETDSTPTLATNTAGEALHAPSEIASGAEHSASVPSEVQDAHARQDELDRKDALAAAIQADGGDRPLKVSEDSKTLLENEREERDESSMGASIETLKPSSVKNEVESNETFGSEGVKEVLSAGVHEDAKVTEMPGAFDSSS